MTALHVRLASRDDSEILTRIHAEGFAHYWDVNAFNDFFGIIGTVAMIAEIDAEPVAMLVYRVVQEQSDIITIAVRPSYRRRKIAEILMSQAMIDATKHGAEVMFLDVEDGNVAALELYKKLGFSQINCRKLYYRQKDGSYTDALVMTKKLA